MAFTYKKHYPFSANSDGAATKLAVDYSKHIANDVFAYGKIAAIEVVYLGYSTYSLAADQVTVIRTDVAVTPKKVSAHGQIVEIELNGAIPATSPNQTLAPFDGMVTPMFLNLNLSFDLV